jgi:hypothetical protein
MQELRADAKLISKYILKKYSVRVWITFGWLRTEKNVVGFCEHGSERVPQKAVYSSPAEQLSAIQNVLCSLEMLVIFCGFALF